MSKKISNVIKFHMRDLYNILFILLFKIYSKYLSKSIILFK